MEATDVPTFYEDIRRQRLKENEKRMEELGLSGLSKDLSKIVSPVAKPAPKPRPPKQIIFEIRRSSRVASIPAPNYREADHDIPLGRRSYSRTSHLPRRYASDKARIEATEKALEVQRQLNQDNPSCVKPMLQSHVSGGFWLSLPLRFCKLNLPKKDDTVVLEDDAGAEWPCVYLLNKNGLSGGWRGFSIDHGLEDGDAIVFERIRDKRLKVHIVRVEEDGSEEVEAGKNVKPKNGKKQETRGSQKKCKKRWPEELANEMTVPVKGTAKKKKVKHVKLGMDNEEDSGDESMEKEKHLTGFFHLRKGHQMALKKSMVPVSGQIEVY